MSLKKVINVDSAPGTCKLGDILVALELVHGLRASGIRMSVHRPYIYI